MSDSDKVIAFCGTRGLPATYGGFETAVDQITRRFVDAGYSCDVFCRTSGTSRRTSSHEKRYLVYVNGSSSSKLDTFVSSIQTGVYLWKNRKRYSHVFWFNNANFPGILLTRLAGLPMSVNTDGLEWRRAKWSWPFKLYYLLSSFLIARCCRTLISDSSAIQDYYRRRFLKKTSLIPYGTPEEQVVSPQSAAQILEQLGLERNRYFLQITRFEPDNLPLQIATGFQQSGLANSGYSMVIVGFKDATPYAMSVKSLRGLGGVQALNAIYDPETLSVLRSNCFCYVHGNSVGGTNPALLEAMACCPRVMAVDSPFSHEVLGDSGYYFNPSNIALAFNEATELRDCRAELANRVLSLYQWDAVAESYMNLAEDQPADYRPRPVAPREARTTRRRQTAHAM